MNNKNRFRKSSGSKSKSAPTAFISFHSNKPDEDQLEFSYGGDTDSLTTKENNDIVDCPSTSSEKESILDYEVEKQLALNTSTNYEQKKMAPKTITESEFDILRNAVPPSKVKQESKDSSPVTDSVKEYFSKISRRPCSLDSELGLFEKKDESTEGWPFFRDIKGKITKTLEDHISKDSKLKSSVEREKFMTKQYAVEEFESLEDDVDSDHTPTDHDNEKTDDSHLSPAVEAAELMNEQNMFESYVNNELDKAKCEIMSTTSDETCSTANIQLSSPKTLPSRKSEISMTLSSLMANRQPSTENSNDFKNTDQEETCGVKNEHTNEKPIVLNENYSLEKNILYKSLLRLKRFCHFIMSSWYNPILRVLIVVASCVAAPIPTWFSGFMIGFILASAAVYWLLKPRNAKEIFTLPNYSKMPPLTIPSSEAEDEPIIYKGWMNELPFEYNPDTYHVNCTHSVYIRLDRSYLRISYPKNNVPKRAMFNEPRHELQFVHQRHHNITGASVELCPKGLARKRLWSKKYPICLTIPNPKQAGESQSSKDICADEGLTTSKVINSRDSPIKKFVPIINENKVVMYLFSRTDREKDIWYNRFKSASKIKMLKSHSPSSSPNIAAIDNPSLENKRAISLDLASLQLCSNFGNINSVEDDEVDNFTDITLTKQLKFEMYMSQLLSALHLEHSQSRIGNVLNKDRSEFPDNKLKTNSVNQHTPNLMWLNVLIGRIFFDFLTEDVWAKVVAERIQRKLSKIKLPNFLEELTVKDINLGTSLPKIHRASDPAIDQRGLWIDIDLSYNGSFQMTLETKLNLLRLNKSDSEEFSLADLAKEKENLDRPLRSHVYNSEEEDTAESSSDEDIPLPEISESPNVEESGASSSQIASGSTGKKILRFMDRLAQSTYFQHATKNKYIKRYMEEVSNTPIVLTVEVHWLTGTLAVNIPAMPTDRLWYGFRKNPSLSIVARPKLGERAVTITHVTDWIEKKLVSEFQKILVMPNMDDLIIPIMLPDLDLPKA